MCSVRSPIIELFLDWIEPWWFECTWRFRIPFLVAIRVHCIAIECRSLLIIPLGVPQLRREYWLLVVESCVIGVEWPINRNLDGGFENCSNDTECRSLLNVMLSLWVASWKSGHVFHDPSSARFHGIVFVGVLRGALRTKIRLFDVVRLKL